MGNFIRLMWQKVKKLFFILIVIFILFFLMNFFFPAALNPLRQKSSFYSQSSGATSVPLRMKIYNMFFKNSIISQSSKVTQQASTTNSSSTKIVRDYQPYVWGGGDTLSKNHNKLNENDLYLYLNDENNEVAKDFKFDGILVRSNAINVLSPNTVITGEISSAYLSSYYFNIDIFNGNGEYLYSIPATAYLDPKDKNTLLISATNRQIYNSGSYTGDGFMVIWSDMGAVESILIANIAIEN